MLECVSWMKSLETTSSVGIGEDALEVRLARLLHRGADFLVAGFLDRVHRQVDDETVGVGTRKDMPVSLPLTSGIARPTALAAPVVEGMMLIAARAAAFPVLLRGTVHRLLRGGVAVDRGHQTFLDAEAFLEKDVDDRRQAVRGATGVGNDVVLGRVVLLVVDAHDDGDVLALGRARR